MGRIKDWLFTPREPEPDCRWSGVHCWRPAIGGPAGNFVCVDCGATKSTEESPTGGFDTTTISRSRRIEEGTEEMKRILKDDVADYVVGAGTVRRAAKVDPPAAAVLAHASTKLDGPALDLRDVRRVTNYAKRSINSGGAPAPSFLSAIERVQAAIGTDPYLVDWPSRFDVARGIARILLQEFGRGETTSDRVAKRIAESLGAEPVRPKVVKVEPDVANAEDLKERDAKRGEVQHLLEVIAGEVIALLRPVYTDEAVQLWLNARQQYFGGESPNDLLKRGEVELVLERAHQIADGNFA